MNKLGMLMACLVAGTAGASPSVDTSGDSVALWVKPLGLLTLAPVMAAQGDTFVMLPVGMNVPLSATQELVLELTPMWTRQDCEARCTTRALSLSVGPSWTVVPTAPGSGFFLQPKLVGMVAQDSREAADGVPFDEGAWTETGTQLSLGLDVGYQLRRGHLFLAFTVGASVGRGWNVSSRSQSAFFALLDHPERTREDKWVWDVNAHLLRVGATF